MKSSVPTEDGGGAHGGAEARLVNGRRILLISVAAIAVLVGAPFAVERFQDRKPGVDPQPIIRAIEAFCRDRTAAGKATPASISFRELVAGGYLAASEIRAFAGLDVSVSTNADETRPQSIMMRVRLPDGMEIDLHADGSTGEVVGR